MTSPANYHEAGPDTQGDITDIDSIIEINGREIATTLETPVIYHGAMRGTTPPSPSPSSSGSISRPMFHEDPGPARKRVNERGA